MMNGKPKGGWMEKVLDRVLQFFDENDWGYEVSPDEGVVSSKIRMDCGTFYLEIFVDEKEGAIGLVMPVTPWTPERKRAAVCEYLTRMNWSAFLGSLHMDLRDGQVVFRNFMGFFGGELSVEMVGCAVLEACDTVKRAYPGLMAVTWNGLTPAEATGDAKLGEVAPAAMVQ